MIEIFGDVIYFDGRQVGLVIVPNGTLRARFEESIEDGQAMNHLTDKLEEVKNILDEIL